MFWKTESKEILTVSKVLQEDGELILKCPHCGEIRGVWDEEDALGGQYQDNLCSGHYEISDEAIFVRSVEILEKEHCEREGYYEEDFDE